MLDLNIPGTSKSTGILQGYQYYMLKHENFSTARGISHVYTVLPPILQDTVVVIPPYPFTLQDPQGVPCAIPCRKVLYFPTVLLHFLKQYMIPSLASWMDKLWSVLGVEIRLVNLYNFTIVFGR